MTELVLWRHADAYEGSPDMQRRLSPLGLRQARAMAQWLRSALPAGYEVYCSPAERTRQTASALTDTFTVEDELAPPGSLRGYAQFLRWPQAHQGTGRVLVAVGHQPNLGALAATLLSEHEFGLDFQKGSVWWFSTAEPETRGRVVLKAVMTPAVLGVVPEYL